MILKGAQPFFLAGGEHGVLLIHGFTGSPAEMVLLGERLHREGFTVLGIRLSGHGTSPENMAKMDWQDWYDSVYDGYAILKGFCTRISVVGLSMGGLMALYLSVHAVLHKVVSLSAPIFIAEEKNLKFLPSREDASGKFAPKHRKKMVDIPKECNVSYSSMPLVCVYQLLDFIKTAKTLLAEVCRPLLIIQSRKDHTVQAKSGAYIYDHVGTEEKELFWLEKSGHLVTIDIEREIVFKKVAGFLAAE
jgi:carboxylesterase